MAGVGFGRATSSTIYAIKVLSDSGSGTFADVICGIDAMILHARGRGIASVANLSLGGGASTAVDNAIRSAVGWNIHVTVAAGNENTNAALFSPARVSEASGSL